MALHLRSELVSAGVSPVNASCPKQVNAGYIDMTIPFSAGALYSTTGDLLKWEQALFGGKVLKPYAAAYYVHELDEEPGVVAANFTGGIGPTALFAVAGQDDGI